MSDVQRIYMDANATTPVLPEVVEAMRPFWTDHFGNASAVHEPGRVARSAVDEARESVAALIGAAPAELVFTSGGTESDNHALFGVLAPGQHLVTSRIEHHAVLHAAEELERRGIEVTYLDCGRGGFISPGAVRDALRPNTRLISIMLANNETGVLQPIREIARIAHQHGCLLHTDAVQHCGKVALDVRDLDCDLLSISAHKMHAPKGVGALWIRRGLQVKPILHGGPHERQKRAGTENVPGIVAFGEAARRTQDWLKRGGTQALKSLHDRFEAELLLRIPDAAIHGATSPRLPNTTSLCLNGVDAESLVIALDLQGMSISGGSACTSGAIEPSHVLLAMDISDEDARSTVRISLSRLNTGEEMDRALTLLEQTVKRARGI